VERVLSLRHTCRIRGRPTFPILVDAVSCLFKGEKPDLSWLTQHESLLVPSTRDQIRCTTWPRSTTLRALYLVCGSTIRHSTFGGH
jgi:hypothetical protein